MSFIGLKCPNCNGEIQMDDTKVTGFCMYCGSNFQVKDEVQKIQIEHSGSIKIDRDEEIDNLVIRTKQKINEFRSTPMPKSTIFSEGKKIQENYIDKLLDIQPDHPEAVELKRFLAQSELDKYKVANKITVYVVLIFIAIVIILAVLLQSCS